MLTRIPFGYWVIPYLGTTLVKCHSDRHFYFVYSSTMLEPLRMHAPSWSWGSMNISRSITGDSFDQSRCRIAPSGMKFTRLHSSHQGSHCHHWRILFVFTNRRDRSFRERLNFTENTRSPGVVRGRESGRHADRSIPMRLSGVR